MKKKGQILEIALVYINFLYIWSAHYARSARGWGLFDHQKQIVVRGYFCWPFSFFVIFFTACNFCKLFFYY
jgi:hypothetical protein